MINWWFGSSFLRFLQPRAKMKQVQLKAAKEQMALLLLYASSRLKVLKLQPHASEV